MHPEISHVLLLESILTNLGHLFFMKLLSVIFKFKLSTLLLHLEFISNSSWLLIEQDECINCALANLLVGHGLLMHYCLPYSKKRCPVNLNYADALQIYKLSYA